MVHIDLIVAELLFKAAIVIIMLMNAVDLRRLNDNLFELTLNVRRKEEKDEY